MRLLLIALLSLALSACWTGVDLYSARDARPLLVPGTYRVTPPNEPSKTYRVSMLEDGMTEFDDGEEKDAYGFSPLPGERNLFVSWAEPGGAAGNARREDQADQTYFLVTRQTDGTFLIYLPECTGAAGEIARAAGAKVESGECRFATRASLESALRLLPKNDKSAIKLVRI